MNAGKGVQVKFTANAGGRVKQIQAVQRQAFEPARNERAHIVREQKLRQPSNVPGPRAPVFIELEEPTRLQCAQVLLHDERVSVRNGVDVGPQGLHVHGTDMQGVCQQLLQVGRLQGVQADVYANAGRAAPSIQGVVQRMADAGFIAAVARDDDEMGKSGVGGQSLQQLQ